MIQQLQQLCKFSIYKRAQNKLKSYEKNNENSNLPLLGKNELQMLVDPLQVLRILLSCPLLMFLEVFYVLEIFSFLSCSLACNDVAKILSN